MLLTPELKAYAARIVIERNIEESQMTPELMGEVLQAAMNRMDAVACELIDQRSMRAREARRDMAALTYVDIVARHALNA